MQRPLAGKMDFMTFTDSVLVNPKQLWDVLTTIEFKLLTPLTTKAKEQVATHKTRTDAK